MADFQLFFKDLLVAVVIMTDGSINPDNVITKVVTLSTCYLLCNSHHLKTMHREAARRVKLQNENWNREQNLNGKRINSGCVTESVTAPGLLFQPRGGPGTELSRILTMYLQRRMPLSELSRESV